MLLKIDKNCNSVVEFQPTLQRVTQSIRSEMLYRESTDVILQVGGVIPRCIFLMRSELKLVFPCAYPINDFSSLIYTR